jgi:hypothetical protein
MVSELLHHAIEDIRDYLKEFPDIYTKEWRKPIGRVIAEMTALVEQLEAPGSPERGGRERMSGLRRREEEFLQRRDEEWIERSREDGPGNRNTHCV